ncbi:NAD(P)-dependent oxidoreductase [Oscillatoria salina]|uniref:NAD(P)-dependent oxidoreductase n=1 Tax=Oscillatoria salina TaxID=331517 RepID=UPI0013BAC15E|nr:NAD(P)-dependent oxidoreductase [Oscillatoria salina]MBZ8183087.1 glyoxylate/hydroxypyruvate reductase A [Oscillatoria salina IIICB1]NET87522.1 glyoxylate/hydroxypyruvate reductase A [Kamptonema sp. SIO1D9]
MKTILLHSEIPGAQKFQEVLEAETVGFRVALSIDEVAPEDVEIAIIWLTVPDYLQRLPNLKLILVCGSGVDSIIHATTLPRHISLVRLVDPFLRDRVSDYVIKSIQNHILSRKDYFELEDTSDLTIDNISFPKLTVGIMGLGLVGEATAKKLLALGFNVCGWVRTSRPRALPQVYVGKAELGDFARKSQILVCLLPLTNQTQGILNCHLFDQLPDSSFLINVGRGDHLNEADLLSALDSGKLSGACLDVFKVEPLPADHLFQSHPKITVTPHIAGGLVPEQQATYAARVIACHYRGEIPPGVVDFHASY